MSILALIPARGGSKGLPGKNIMSFCEKPLLAWSIEAAKESLVPISRIVVSSEDEEILNVAREYGAHCPFIRPAELATDGASGLDSVLHALDWLAENENYHPEWLLLLQPTSPLRIAADIDSAYQLVLEHEVDSVMGVTEAQSHPMWTKTIDENGRLCDFIDRKEAPAIRQDLPLAYVVNGAMYLIRTDILQRDRSFSNDETLAYVMPPERSVDIDTEFDFKIAAFLKNEALNQA
ncbi:acylneuraminate cytidylyltransferase family protein [Akkermansiaceae bacterium]|nr:acylneuraminate cytidylyltransferase family protein [Akkermansiaceae bacterium]